MASRITKEIFIRRARQCHGDKYDYSKVIMKNMETKVEIICPTHGSFFQRPTDHVNSTRARGCPKCAFYNVDKFIKKARQCHGDKYDYSNVEFNLSLSAKEQRVEIICPTHGSFFQRPIDHANNQRPKGCPKCGEEARAIGYSIDEAEKIGFNKEGYIYILNCFNDNESFYKIGHTTTSIKTRYPNEFMPYDYEVVLISSVGLVESVKLENSVLEMIAKKNLQYKPKIYFPGHTECCSVNPIELDHHLEMLYEDFRSNQNHIV